MSAIFISYTGRDPEGDIWADRLAEWCREWNYGYFRDKDHSHGIKAGEEWRPALYRALGLAQAMVCLCSQQDDSSPWSVGEVALFSVLFDIPIVRTHHCAFGSGLYHHEKGRGLCKCLIFFLTRVFAR